MKKKLDHGHLMFQGREFKFYILLHIISVVMALLHWKRGILLIFLFEILSISDVILLFYT